MSPEGECSQAEESSTMAGVVLDQAHYPLNASPSTGAEPTAQHPSSMSIPSVDTTTDVLEMINRGANTQPKSHSSSSIPSIEIDVERFEGKIVYNPDGSAYIIEGESELSEDDSLPEGCIVDGRGISVPHTQEFPQIASAYYVSRSYNPQGYQYQSDRKPIISSSSEFPIMHSYRVFTYRYNGGKSPLQQPDSESMISATSVPIKPILMCFICKLSFGHVKSFTSHAGHEHELSLLESEKRVLSHSTTSAIIQVVGRNKQPIISILEPILQPPSHENVSEQIRSLCSRNGESDCDKKSLNEKEIDGHLKNISHNTNKSAPGSNETILAQKSIITDSVECQLEQQQFRWINVPISYNSASSSTFSKSLSNSSMHTLHQPPNFVSGTTIGVCPEHLQGRPSGIECTKCEGILMNTRLSTTGGPSTGIHSRNSCKTLKCPKCNWHYKYQETLEIHMKEKHPDAEISCIYCISGQPHPRLARGETYTCGYKPYRCEVCNYSTTTKGNLSIHMQSDKHLNNMQELQQGGGGLNSNDAQSRQDSSMHNQNSHSCHSPSVIGQSMGHGKSKPVFRCDACNYETNVARNLRIHMTSEKHTHHMMVLQSSIKHMRTLSALQSHQQQTHQNRIQRQQQIEQLLQLGDLDKTQQAEAALADMAYSQALMIQMMTGGRFPLNVTPDSPETLDSGNLTNIGSHMGMQSESIEPPPDPSDPDPYYLYQCCICNNFSTDSVESLGAHLALDRTTTVEGEILGNISGHFICKLCSYKTNLKANFQLHCKTDKHLQRLQHVNHVKEGGSKNEWKLKYLASPSSAAQIRCHACDYYTNSIHKLALHSASPRHEAASLLFRHLCESSLNISSYSKLYHCSLCGFSARNRLPLLQHVRSYRHIQMEQLHQLQKSSGSRGNENLHTDIAEIFQVSPDPNKIVELEPSSQMQAASDCNPSTEQAENDSDSSSEMKNDLEHDSEGNESGIRISCSHCPSQSSSNEDLRSTTQSAYGRQHIDDLNESEQESDRDILCPLCQECFKQRSALEKHVMQIHSVNSDGLQRLLLLVNQSHWLNTSSKHVATSIPCPEPMVASPTGVLTNKDWKQLTIDDGDSTMTCKLCLKVYRSSEEFQKHSKELHPTVIPNLAVSEKHVYKYRCGQCSLAFKTLEKLQQHSQYHAIRDATKCSLCCRSFRSMQSLHRHLESSHGEPSMNDGLICKELKVDNSETPVQTLVRGEFCQEEPCMDGNLLDDSGKVEEDDNETHDSPPSHKEHQVAEDYMNSQSMAEDHYSDPNRKFRCHRCKVAFTKHPYLSGHNKSLSHRKGEKPQYPMEKYLDPNRPYKCDICKESFTQKNILLVHYNSVSHLHKLKRAMQEQGDNNVQMNITPITTSVNLVERRNDQDKKPFKCHLCQVAYTQSSTLEIHKKSVLHQSRACRVHEPAISNHSDSTHSVADLPVLGPNASSTNTSPDGGSQISSWSEFFTPVSNQAEILRNYQSQCASNETYALFHQLETMNNSIKSEIKKQPVTVSSSGLHEKCFQYVGSQSTSTPMELQYDSSHKTSQMYTHLLESFGFDLVMQFNETHREKVSNQGGKAVSANAQQQGEREPLNEENELDNQNKPQSDEESFYMNHIDAESVPEMEKSTCQHCQQDFSSVWVLKAHCEEVHKDLVPHEFLEKYAQQFKNEYDKRIVIVTAATSSSTATMPITTSPLIFYAQDANSHDDLRGSEDGGRNQMIRVPEATSTTPNLNPSVLEERSNDDSVIPTTSVDGRRSMIPQHEHSQLTIAQHMSEMHAVFNALAATQLQQLQQYPSLMMSMMSLPLGINIPALAAMNLQPPLIPLMLPSTTFEATSGSFDDSATSSELLAQQNLTLQQQQLVNSGVSQKRSRTRITDDQLKILRAHFDINNSPGEDQIIDMASQSGLPPKVIKHWFRNTLFKERQRNKDSPYNFNNPPCTTLNLEEYEKTGEAKVVSLPPDGSEMNQIELTCPDEHIKDDENRIHSENKNSDCKHPNLEDSQELPLRILSPARSLMSQNSRAESPSTIPSRMTNSSSPMLPPKIVAQNHNDPICGASHAHTTTFSLAANHEANSPIISSELMHNGLSNSSSNGNSNSGKRANRTRFTDYQIKVLQEFFENNAYPKDDDLEYLSKLLGLSPRVIVVWFQNARQKARKVYENQPSIESVNTGGRENDESAGRFQRTPSLNYQCKKCLLVFQRYYELIRHQKTHCFKEEDAKRSAQAQAAAAQVAAVFSSEDSNSSSAATTNIFPLNTTTMQIVSDPPLVSGLTNHPNRASSPRHLIQQTCRLEFQEGSYRCDKCDKVFGRFDSWREHQLTHIIDPNLFSLKYPSNSAFGILQQQAINRRSPLLKGSQPSANVNEESKRKLDTYGNNDDSVTKLSSDNIEQPRDKRLRTTILPEQLDFLYQKYQTESNPSRKMLETIAREVGLKKRVVQVWFQNTRARERKGQFRAHNQVINKRCPFCPALFKVKSALESHLNSKHIDQIPRKGINIDSIPDEELSLESSHSSSSAPNTASSIFSPTLADIGAPYKKYYEESMKRYISEMRLHAMNEKRDSKKSSLVVSQTESPLDLSKPVDLSTSVSISATSGFTEDQNNTQRKHSTVEYGLLLESAEKSICDDDSTSGTVEFFDDESDPLSPASSSQGSSKFGMSSFSIFSNSTTYSGANLSQQSGGKRYRTQMSTTQVKVMKSLFSDYKTPTMAECEMLGQEIGLPKRVVQVWFQNARAKEKKAKIAMGSNREGVISHQSPTGPEECKLCCIKYSSKLSIQEHVFTTKHLECVKIAVEDGSLVPPTPGAPSFRESAIANTMDGDLQGNQFQTDENIMYGSLFLHPTVVFQSQHQQQQQHTGNVTTSTTHSTTGESLADLLDS